MSRSHRFAYFLPEEISPSSVAIGDDLLQKTNMGDNFIEEHLGGLLFHKIGHAQDEEGVFGELTDENEDRVITLTFGEFSDEVHGDDCIGIGMG